MFSSPWRSTVPGLCLVVPLVGIGCTAADGSVSGGEPFYVDPCASDGGAATWNDLYTCYFGPSGSASCGFSNCHGSPNDQGTLQGGFLCGLTPATCWAGMTTGIQGSTPIVPPGSSSDPTETPLWLALRKPFSEPACAGNATCDNMPQMPASFVFAPADLDRIQAWIENGAPGP